MCTGGMTASLQISPDHTSEKTKLRKRHTPSTALPRDPQHNQNPDATAMAAIAFAGLKLLGTERHRDILAKGRNGRLSVRLRLHIETGGEAWAEPGTKTKPGPAELGRFAGSVWAPEPTRSQTNPDCPAEAGDLHGRGFGAESTAPNLTGVPQFK